MKKEDLDELIRLSKLVAKPWYICTWVLSALLLLSLLINAYLIKHRYIDLNFIANNNIESDINQSNN